MKPTQQLAERLAKNCCDKVINQFLIDSLTPDRAYSNEAEVYETIPLLELLEVARAADNYVKIQEADLGNIGEYCLKLEEALSNLKQKLPEL